MNDKNLWKTKEYRNFELIFGGECEKSLERLIRWNGNGKEFDRKGKLIFEGEYFEGKRWNGKGKEYNNKNELEFDGKYINCKKRGVGKVFNNKGELIFEGEYFG